MLRLGRGGEGGQQRKPRVRGEGTVLKPRGKKYVKKGVAINRVKAYCYGLRAR